MSNRLLPPTVEIRGFFASLERRALGPFLYHLINKQRMHLIYKDNMAKGFFSAAQVDPEP